ncbi:MAG: potassium-transporting ATPase subunit KdpA [Fimbriimonadia bacterium]|nr:potassium-transporting ATPase subunit KdpA [Fimbriimonadia bacterium]
MTIVSWIQIGLYMVALVAFTKPLGMFMARVYQGERTWLHPLLSPLEQFLYRMANIKAEDEMDWKTYAKAALVLNLFGLLMVYALQRLQFMLPFNPAHMLAVPADSAFNTAVSFASNTNWQGYGGETTMSYLTQMFGLGVQNFLSAATGMAVLAAFIRGFAREQSQSLGNFWADLTRTVLYILLPLSLTLSLALVSQGVVQSLQPAQTASLMQPVTDEDGSKIGHQTLPLGPAASQIAIKQLGTNGGGFFNTNSSHPFENPTPLSNFLQMLAILLIPSALCYTFGSMVKDTRQGWAIWLSMTLIFVGALSLTLWAEQQGNPVLSGMGADQQAGLWQSGGNMEGKETRFGIANSALWATATTAASNGSVNSMHDSYTPLGGLGPLWLIQLGEIVFGGVGSGLYGMLVFAIIAVFIAGLMVGRAPEYLGKKIEVFEIKMASLVALIPVLTILGGTAAALLLYAGIRSIQDPGPHGISEVLYAFSSAGNNNGSAFAGLNANTPFYNVTLGLAMLAGRYWIILPVLAIAGSLAAKKRSPVSLGTLPTHTPLFIGWLVGVVVMVGALSFFPALALGPIVEHLMLK